MSQLLAGMCYRFAASPQSTELFQRLRLPLRLRLQLLVAVPLLLLLLLLSRLPLLRSWPSPSRLSCSGGVVGAPSLSPKVGMGPSSCALSARLPRRPDRYDIHHFHPLPDRYQTNPVADGLISQ